MLNHGLINFFAYFFVYNEDYCKILIKTNDEKLRKVLLKLIEKTLVQYESVRIHLNLFD